MSILPALSAFDLFPALPIGVTKLTGQDNKTFLQGQLTCDLDNLSSENSLLGAHCDAKGKMLAVLQLVKSGEDMLALQAIDNVESHLPSLKKYAVFSKVEITDAHAEYHFTGLSGDAALVWANSLSDQQLSAQQDTIDTTVGIITSYPRCDNDTPRLLVISQPSQLESLTQALAATEATTQDSQYWFAADIVSGSPQILPSQQGEHVPQMLNLQMIDGISFKKGCYIGQETVARMHYRGTNKRAMFVLSASSHLECNVGDSLEKQIGENWRNAGTIVNVAHSNNVTVANAILAVDTDLDSSLRLKEGDDSQRFNVTKPHYMTLAD